MNRYIGYRYRLKQKYRISGENSRYAIPNSGQRARLGKTPGHSLRGHISILCSTNQKDWENLKVFTSQCSKKLKEISSGFQTPLMFSADRLNHERKGLVIVRALSEATCRSRYNKHRILCKWPNPIPVKSLYIVVPLG